MPDKTHASGMISDAQEEGEVRKRSAGYESSLATADYYAQVLESARQAAKANRMPEEQRQQMEKQRVLSEHINFLGLSTEVVNSLEDNDIHTVFDLLQQTEEKLRLIPNIGSKSMKEIFAALAEHGYKKVPPASTR